MKCPYCSKIDNKVIDSRLRKDGRTIRRRRECIGCERRFTTYEKLDELLPMVIKKDSRREPFDRAKILAGLKKACEKRPVSIGALGAAVDRIEKRLQDLGENEVPSRTVGEEVMRALQELDPVAYVRFASVYREYKDIDQFMDTIRALTHDKGRS